MKRPDAEGLILSAFVVVGGVLLWRHESAAAVMALATAAAFRWASVMLRVKEAREHHQKELHEVRLALSILGDPEVILRRLDDLAAEAEKVKRAPEQVDGLRDAVKASAAGLDERLKKIEGFLSETMTREGLGRRLRFGQE